MPVTHLIQVACAQCGTRLTYDNLRTAQEDGWKQVDHRPIGASSDSSDLVSTDICPLCFESVFDAITENRGEIDRLRTENAKLQHRLQKVGLITDDGSYEIFERAIGEMQRLKDGLRLEHLQENPF